MRQLAAEAKLFDGDAEAVAAGGENEVAARIAGRVVIKPH